MLGDPHHRPHMQSIVDKLHSPQLLSNALQEFKSIVYKLEDSNRFSSIIPHLETVAKTDCEQGTLCDRDNELPAIVDWEFLNNILASLRTIMDNYIQFSRK